MINELLKLKHTLRFSKDGSFKILYLSDIHAKGGYGVLLAPGKAHIKTLIDREKPNLIIMNGDTAQMCNDTAEMKTLMDSIVEYIEERKIPWAHVFGNHDDQLYSHMTGVPTKEEQQAIYESYDYCISKDVKGLYGVGNFLLPVLGSTSDEIAFNVWCMDSNTYLTKEEMERHGVTYECDYIHQDQIDWYTGTSSYLEDYYGRKIYGVMNFHVPLPEFLTAWKERANHPFTGQKNERVCHSHINSGLFDAIRNQGDVKAVICGHDHNNDYAVDYRGVKLCYAGKIGINGYYRADRLGARVVTVREADPANIETYISYINRPRIVDDLPPLHPDILQDFNYLQPRINVSSLNGNKNENQNLGQLEAKIVPGKGINHSAALAFTRHSTPGEPGWDSRNIELEIDLSTFGKLGNNRYLRFWFDFTGNDGKTPLLPLAAAAGLITNYNYAKNADYCTDYGPAGIQFHYLPMGDTQWQTLAMNDDGCFGKVGGHEILRGAKGWLAFPIKDMLQAGTGDALCSEDVITTAYLYYSLNHEEPETYGQYVIIDDIALAEDYKVF